MSDARARAAAESLLPCFYGTCDHVSHGRGDCEVFMRARIDAVVADAVAQAVKERDEEIAVLRRHLSVMTLDKMQQAEEIAQLKADLVGAEATNALLDEEVARLRAAFATSGTDEEQRLRGLFECIATDTRRGTAFESWARQWAREALRRAPTEP